MGSVLEEADLAIVPELVEGFDLGEAAVLEVAVGSVVEEPGLGQVSGQEVVFDHVGVGLGEAFVAEKVVVLVLMPAVAVAERLAAHSRGIPDPVEMDLEQVDFEDIDLEPDRVLVPEATSDREVFLVL